MRKQVVTVGVCLSVSAHSGVVYFCLPAVGDLTGTLVESTQRIAVLSGNVRTAVGSGSSRDHLVAMLPPTESWGRLYCTVPIPGADNSQSLMSTS